MAIQAGFAASCAATMCDASQPPQVRDRLKCKQLRELESKKKFSHWLFGGNFAAVAPQLLALCRRPDVTPELLSCFGQIAEQWQCSGAGLLPGSAELTKATLSFLSPTTPAPLRGAAAEALCLLVPVSVGATKEAAGEVFSAALAAGTGEAELRLLGVAACEFYEALGTPQLQQMVDLCRGTLRGTGEASQVQAVELWAAWSYEQVPVQYAEMGIEALKETLAAYELYLLDGKQSDQCRGLLQQALPNLMPLLLEALQARPSTWQSGSWDPEEDASPVQEAACGAVTVAKARITTTSTPFYRGLELLDTMNATFICRLSPHSTKTNGQVTGDACVGPILQFASAAMSSQDAPEGKSVTGVWDTLQSVGKLVGKEADEWQRRSALLAFGAIQDGPSAQALRPFVASALPKLLEALRSHPVPEASAAAWTLGRVLDKNPGSVADEAQAVLFDAALHRLRAEAALAEELCYCLDGLVDQQVRILSDRWSYDSRLGSEVGTPLTEKLHWRAELGLSTSLEQALYFWVRCSFESRIATDPEECLPQMESLLDEVLKQAREAELEEVGGAAARGLFCCLRVLIVRLGP
ncbi:Kpnb1 [Symbiodinium necroappetens]|uniref:Kpnb1 protein n=1 Tax=Symbiodinium necroappetens TaxID=1628268 RepID=A0A813AIW9_9DINO|nr:Kpnb1 [Symbiodinium necroappetens]